MYGWIQATGTITEDTPKKFERFLKSPPDEKNALVILATIDGVAFHSPGGSLMAGLQLGEIIRKNGFNTTVGNSIPLQGFGQIMKFI
jgi:hypothetical protein